jgi:hypothetical protein
MLNAVNPTFINGHYASQEVITFCFVLLQNFLAGDHTIFLNWLTMHPAWGHFVEPQYIMK